MLEFLTFGPSSYCLVIKIRERERERFNYSNDRKYKLKEKSKTLECINKKIQIMRESKVEKETVLISYALM